jgi:hypothetical protein
MSFWDTAAITPLLVHEADSIRREGSLARDQAELAQARCRSLQES